MKTVSTKALEMGFQSEMPCEMPFTRHEQEAEADRHDEVEHRLMQHLAAQEHVAAPQKADP